MTHSPLNTSMHHQEGSTIRIWRGIRPHTHGNYNQQHAIYSDLSTAHRWTLPHGLRLKTIAYHYNTHKPVTEESSSRTTIEEF